jgi:diaphanous 2
LFCTAAILLGSLKLPYNEIKRRIVEMDEDKFDVAQIEQLIRYMPEPEFKDEYDSLSEPEQFAVTVSGCN